MKLKKFVSSTIIVSIFVSIFALPLNTNAKTIREFEAEVKKYTEELEAKKNQVVTNEAEVIKIKRKISDIEKQIKETEKEVEKLQKEIDESNEEIEQKTEESKRILEYYQISNGNNAYLEYAFGATSITDMIYRLSVIEQLTDYNDKIMKELEVLIEKNKKQQEELKSKRKSLEGMKNNLVQEQQKINSDIAYIKAGMPTIEKQIKAAQSQLDYYTKLGCGPTEDIQACQHRKEQEQGGSSIPSVNGFYRPMENGYITQGYYGYGGHLGMDLSSSNKKIPIYPIADGQLFFVGYDSAGALIVKLRHELNGSYIYSTYAHMSSFSSAVSPYIDYTRGSWESIKNGPYISADTPLGNMGSTGNSSGPHLHFEMTTCDWHRRGGCTWGDYQKRTLRPTDYIRIPSRWNNR